MKYCIAAPIGFRRQQAHVHLHAAAQAKADFIFAAGDDLHQARKFDDVLDQLFSSVVIAAGLACDQDVEIADGFASAAQRACGRNLLDLRIIFQMVDDFLGFPFRRVEQETPGDAPVVFDGLKQLLFVLLSHAGKLANLSLSRQFFHALKIADLIGAPDQRNRLWSQALNLEQIKHGRPILLQ